MSTVENNILIAEFMGYKKAKCNNGLAWNSECDNLHKLIPIQGRLITNDCSYLKFHSSWDWLMPVVEKIENITNENRQCIYNVEIVQCFTTISNVITSEEIVNTDCNTKIEATYKAVVEFVKWLNE